MTKFLNDLRDMALPAKAVMANSKNDDPIGGIFYYSAVAALPTNATSWSNTNYSSSSTTQLFDEATVALNELPLPQALATKMTMTDKAGGSKALAMFTPSSTTA